MKCGAASPLALPDETMTKLQPIGCDKEADLDHGEWHQSDVFKVGGLEIQLSWRAGENPYIPEDYEQKLSELSDGTDNSSSSKAPA